MQRDPAGRRSGSVTSQALWLDGIQCVQHKGNAADQPAPSRTWRQHRVRCSRTVNPRALHAVCRSRCSPKRGPVRQELRWSSHACSVRDPKPAHEPTEPVEEGEPVPASAISISRAATRKLKPDFIMAHLVAATSMPCAPFRAATSRWTILHPVKYCWY
jgi:hypothetical protein